jgi:hypothetical protein
MAAQIKQYRRQVEVVHGFQYDGTNTQDVIDFTEGAAHVGTDGKLYLKHPGNPGIDQEIRKTDWILNDAWGNDFVMGDNVFKIVYAPYPLLRFTKFGRTTSSLRIRLVDDSDIDFCQKTLR